jgi:hypothetical protein
LGGARGEGAKQMAKYLFDHVVVFIHDDIRFAIVVAQALTPALSQREREIGFRFEISNLKFRISNLSNGI